MRRKSGRVSPSSVKLFSRFSHLAGLNWGVHVIDSEEKRESEGVVEVVKRKKALQSTNTEEKQSTQVEENHHEIQSDSDESSWKIRTQRVALYGPEDLVRTRLTWLMLGLVVSVVLGGLAAIVFLSVVEKPTEATLQYLTNISTLVFSLMTYAVGYHYGKTSSKHK